jgi:hypothetical protein
MGVEELVALVYRALVAFTALVVFAVAVEWVRRSPPVGLWLVGLTVISLWEVPSQPAIVQLSGISVYPTDVITTLFFVVGILEVRQLRANLGGLFVLWMFFGVLIAVSLLRGVGEFGMGTAFNEARTPLYFFFAMTWALAVRPDRLHLHTFSLVLGWALVLVGLYHVARYGIGNAASTISLGDGVLRSGRPLSASQALALLFCAATAMSRPGKVRSQFATVSSLVFLGVVALAQHRSVWIAGLMGIAAVAIWSGRRLARKRAIVPLTVGAWLLLFAWTSGILSGSEYVESAADTGTFDWRTSSWQVLISRSISSGPAVVVGGNPFGTGNLRQLSNGGWTAVSAHNWYVEIFLRLGIAGVITLIAVFLVALAKSRRAPSLWVFVVAAVAGFGWAYSVEWYVAPWLGAAITVSLEYGRFAAASAPKSGPLSETAGLADFEKAAIAVPEKAVTERPVYLSASRSTRGSNYVHRRGLE